MIGEIISQTLMMMSMDGGDRRAWLPHGGNILPNQNVVPISMLMLL